MSIDNSRHVFGSESDVDLAIAQGIIDAYDVLFLSDGRVGWVDRNGSKVITKPGDLVVSQPTPPENTHMLWVDTNDESNDDSDEDDAIALATETGLVSPAAAEDGSIYTDENGVLYIV